MKFSVKQLSHSHTHWKLRLTYKEVSAPLGQWSSAMFLLLGAGLSHHPRKTKGKEHSQFVQIQHCFRLGFGPV